jgi:hypothetical protein
MSDKPQPRSGVSLVRLFVASVLVTALLWTLLFQNTLPNGKRTDADGPVAGKQSADSDGRTAGKGAQ